MRVPRWLSLPAGVSTATAAGLCFVPLFDLLGYEFAFALALVAGPAGAGIGLGAGRAGPDGLAALGRALAGSALQLAPALALISLNAVRVKNCDYLEGLAFFALLPLSSSLYGATIGVVTARALHRARLPLRAAGLVAALAAPLALTLWTLYHEPPIFAFDHLWGYFAGSLYDEVITIDARLLAFRLETTLRIAAVAAVFWTLRRRSRTVTLATAVGAGVVLALYGVLLGPRLGFRVTRDELAAALPDLVERPGLVVHLPAGLDARRRDAIADEHAFELERLRATLGVAGLPTVHSYVYADAAQKARLMGGRGTMVAKPWLFEIHVHDPVTPHPLVGHELAHVVAASFAPPPLRVSSRGGVLVNMGLVEGLAAALTPPAGDLDGDAYARALRELGMAPDMRAILGPGGFWSEAPRRAYTVAGSFVGWLLRAFGPGPLRAVYARGDFDAAYGESLDALVARWEDHVATVPLRPSERALAEHQFQSPGIFARACAHEVAALRARAAAAPSAEAVALYRRVAGFLGESPGARVDVALALARAGDREAFVALAGPLLEAGGLTVGQRARLLETAADIDWSRGDRDRAAARYREVLALGLGPASERLQWVRLWALGLEPPLGDELRAFLRDELAPVAAVLLFEAARRTRPADKTLPYLIARQLETADACAQALDYLDAAAAHPFPPIEAERVRLTAACVERLGRFSEASATYRRYAALAPSPGEALRAMHAAARAAWQHERRAAPAAAASQPAGDRRDVAEPSPAAGHGD